jgi:hypothetical protein
VSFLAVDWERNKPLDEARQIAGKFYKEKNLTIPNHFDLDGKVLDSYGVQSFPTVLVVDTEGRVRFRNIGFHPAGEEIWEAQIRSLLPKKS